MKPWVIEGDIPLLGALAVPGYYFWLTIAFIMGTNVAVREARRSGIPVKQMLDMALIVLLGSLVGARLGHILFENPQSYLDDPMKLLRIWQGGFVYYGGFLFNLACMYVYIRWRGLVFLRVADVFAPVIGLGLCFGRLGCLSAGCCYGRPVDFPLGFPLPWGLTFFSGQVPRALEGVPLHPTQLYLSVLGLALFLWTSRVRRRQKYDGQAFLHLTAWYAVGRSVVELFRFDVDRGVYWGWISTSQLVSVPLLAAALVGMWALGRRARVAPTGVE